MTENINTRNINGFMRDVILREASYYNMQKSCAYMTFDDMYGLCFLPNGRMNWLYGLKIGFEI